MGGVDLNASKAKREGMSEKSSDIPLFGIAN